VHACGAHPETGSNGGLKAVAPKQHSPRSALPQDKNKRVIPPAITMSRNEIRSCSGRVSLDPYVAFEVRNTAANPFVPNQRHTFLVKA